MWYSERDIPDEEWGKIEFGESLGRIQHDRDEKGWKLITEEYTSGIRREILETPEGNISSARIFIPE